MSFTFQVITDKEVTPAELFAALGIETLRCTEDIDVEEPIGAPLHFYLDDQSCRGVQIESNSESFFIKITSPASADDHHLALNIVEELCRLTDAQTIRGEGDETIPATELRTKFGQEWLRKEVEFGVKSILSAAGGITDGAACTMQGCRRNFHVGLRLAVELLALPSPALIENEFFRRFREVQYIEKKGYYTPKIYYNEKTKKKICGIGPNVSYLLPWVQHLALLNADGTETIFVPRVDFYKLIRDRLKWIDEKQVVMDAISEEEWAQIMKEAEEFKETPAAL
jgi:hypothetical protein